MNTPLKNISRIYISRHVVFDEMTFPYKQLREDPTPSNLVLSEFPSMDEWLESPSGSPQPDSIGLPLTKKENTAQKYFDNSTDCIPISCEIFESTILGKVSENHDTTNQIKVNENQPQSNQNDAATLNNSLENQEQLDIAHQLDDATHLLAENGPHSNDSNSDFGPDLSPKNQ